VIFGEKYRPEGIHDFLHGRGTLLLNGRIGNIGLAGLNQGASLLGDVHLEGAYYLSERIAMK